MRFEALNISSRHDAASVHVCLTVSTLFSLVVGPLRALTIPLEVYASHITPSYREGKFPRCSTSWLLQTYTAFQDSHDCPFAMP